MLRTRLFMNQLTIAFHFQSSWDSPLTLVYVGVSRKILKGLSLRGEEETVAG